MRAVCHGWSPLDNKKALRISFRIKSIVFRANRSSINIIRKRTYYEASGMTQSLLLQIPVLCPIHHPWKNTLAPNSILYQSRGSWANRFKPKLKHIPNQRILGGKKLGIIYLDVIKNIETLFAHSTFARQAYVFRPFTAEEGDLQKKWKTWDVCKNKHCYCERLRNPALEIGRRK